VNDPEENLRRIQAALGHAFADVRLLEDALTHSSFANERPGQVRTDNEVLEFLGDAVLQWSVSTLLFARFGAGTAGELTRRRADLVCEEGLAELARDAGIGDGLRLGKGEDRTGGRSKPRLLANAFEACVAAVYLDAGAHTALEVCRGLFEPRIDALSPGGRDHKTRLQELVQGRGLPPPRYALIATTGPDHERSFEVELQIDGQPQARGIGRSKLEAEQTAAAEAMRTFTTAPAPTPDPEPEPL
jgi:ribonuclease-3